MPPCCRTRGRASSFVAVFIEADARLGRVRLCRRRSASALRPELHRDRPDRGHVRDRRPALCRLGAAAREPVRPSRAWRSSAAFLLGIAYLVLAIGFGLVACADRGHRHRARLLRAPQHAADQCHADDAGGARNRGRDLLLGDLSRPDRRRGRGRARLRSLHGRAAVHCVRVRLPILAWWFAGKLRQQATEERRRKTEDG